MTSHELTAALDASADAVFAVLTDIDRLPQWNDIIESIAERPDRLEPGAEWVVDMHALGQGWRSRAHVLEVDATARRFAYRSATDDGNPSWADWTWEVAPLDAGRSTVTVAWDLHPKTFWRRVLFVHVRARQLRRTELPHSLAQLAQVAKAAAGTGGPVTEA